MFDERRRRNMRERINLRARKDQGRDLEQSRLSESN